MLELISTTTESELRFIAALDYGQDKEQHFSALESLLRKQCCNFLPEQGWFPYEVIELGAHSLQPDHQREFVICTLLIIHAVNSGFDKSTDLDAKLADRKSDYNSLNPELSSAIFQAYSSVGL